MTGRRKTRDLRRSGVGLTYKHIEMMGMYVSIKVVVVDLVVSWWWWRCSGALVLFITQSNNQTTPQTTRRPTVSPRSWRAYAWLVSYVWSGVCLDSQY